MITKNIPAQRSLFLVVLFLAGLLVYANSIPGKFVWDDKNLIVNNPDIKEINPDNVKTIFTKDLVYFVERSNFYRPLQSITYMLDHFLWGEDSRGFHLANVLIHIMNGMIMFFIISFLFKDDIIAFLGAFLFTVHPVNTSAVSYIAGRADLLGLMFLLISFFFILKFRHSGSMASANIALFSFIMSLLSKEVCVIFPLFLYTVIFREDEDNKPRNNLLLSLFAFISAIYIVLKLTVLKFAPLTQQAVNTPSLFRRILALPHLVLTYLRLILFPYDLRMDRDFNIPAGIADTTVIFSVIVSAFMVFALWKTAWKNRVFKTGVAYFFIMLLPSLNVIVPLNAPISEHWLYIPFLGISIIFGYFISLALKKYQDMRRFIYGAIAVAFICYSGTAVYINRYWRNEELLFSYIARYKDINPRAYYNLGQQYLESGRYKDAIHEFTKAIKRKPDYFEAVLYTAVAYGKSGDLETAYDYFGKAVKIDKSSTIPYVVFGQLLIEEKQYDDAVKVFKTAIHLNDGDMSLYNSLAIALAEKKLFREAKDAWEKALEIEPSSAEIRENLRKLREEVLTGYMSKISKYAQEGNYPAAIEESNKALEIDNANVTLLNNLGVLYGMVGNDEKAVKTFKEVLKIAPEEAGVYKNIGIICSKYPEKYGDAIRYFRKYFEFPSSGPEKDAVMKKIEEMEKAIGNDRD